MDKPNIKQLIDSLFPDHVRASYPRLIDFAKAFFDYLENENKSAYYQNTIHFQRDIRVQDPEFAEYIKRELGILSRRDYAVDPQIFYENIVKIWQSKGSEESIKTFFRIFLNDEVEVYYPWESVLIPSDGRWVVKNVIRVTPIDGDPEDFVGKQIFQVGSDATAIVDSVERKVYSDVIIYELVLINSSIVSRFSPQTIVYTDDGLRAEIYRSVTGLRILQRGSWYKVGDKISLSGYEGFTFIAYVNGIDSNGGIIDISIANFGSGNTPLNVRELNTLEDYYLIDFLTYQYSDDAQVGPSEVTININTDLGAGAELSINYGALATYSGYYDGVKGQLSESIVLQDSKFYQKFSYEVKTTKSTSQWIQPLKKIAHPSGMMVFGNVTLFQQVNVGIKNYYIFTNKLIPVTYNITEAPGLTDSALAFIQDYFVNEGVYFAEDFFGVTAFNNTSVIAPESTQQSFESEPVITEV
jgi:hypothetical protein